MHTDSHRCSIFNPCLSVFILGFPVFAAHSGIILRCENQESYLSYCFFDFLRTLGLVGSVQNQKCCVAKRALQRWHFGSVLFRTGKRRRPESLGHLFDWRRILQKQRGLRSTGDHRSGPDDFGWLADFRNHDWRDLGNHVQNDVH